MKKIIVQDIQYVDEVEDVELPPPGLSSKFETLQDWLFAICDKEQPDKPIATYLFGVFESPDDYTVFLIGQNTYDMDEHHSVSSIDFKPTHMYFQLPKSEFENRTGEQVKEQLSTQLKDFTLTDKFGQSFFTKAKAIITRFNGEIIWSK